MIPSTLRITVKIDFIEVWNQEIRLPYDGVTEYIEIPPGVIREDYASFTISVEGKGGD